MKRSAKAIAALMLTTMAMFAVGCTKHDDPNNGGNLGGTFNGHEYVDLGLPSGTLWATCNVGADTPEGYGDYFAWGETTPKDEYDLTNYKYARGNNYHFPQLTRYCYDDLYGYISYTDTLTILLPEDDAATANWGDGWCTPTADQWRELKNNTSYVCSTQNGVAGCLLTASNGNSLFLPAAGEWGASEFLFAGSRGCYLSSSLYTGDPDYGGDYIDHPIYAWYSYLDEYEFGETYLDFRFGGRTVRPVRKN